MLIWNEVNGIHRIKGEFRPGIATINLNRPFAEIESDIENLYNTYLADNGYPKTMYCKIESLTPRRVFKLLLLHDGVKEPPEWSDKVNG
jgi:hypothetical protein